MQEDTLFGGWCRKVKQSKEMESNRHFINLGGQKTSFRDPDIWSLAWMKWESKSAMWIPEIEYSRQREYQMQRLRGRNVIWRELPWSSCDLSTEGEIRAGPGKILRPMASPRLVVLRTMWGNRRIHHADTVKFFIRRASVVVECGWGLILSPQYWLVHGKAMRISPTVTPCATVSWPLH
jgi:hypothetical protein